jgi:hypothetical protein
MILHMLFWVGGVGGSIIGIAGGAIGTYLSIRRMPNDRSRRLMRRCSFILWGAIVLLIGLPLSLWLLNLAPRSLFWGGVSAFSILLLPFVLWANHRVAVESQARGWEAAWRNQRS